MAKSKKKPVRPRAAKARSRSKAARKPAPKAPPARARASGGGRGLGHGVVIPCMRYDDAPAAIEFLCKAFGFTKHLVVPGENGTVIHAELAIGNGMIMLGSNVKSDFGRMVALPKEIGGRETQTAYIIVADPDAHHTRAVAAGAEIVLDIKSEDYGGRGYTCRDPEGHIWTFGSYTPWPKG